MKYKRVIFVSTDNTCLGPVAESVFNRIAKGREIQAISRGLIVLFPEPMNAKMVSVMDSHGGGFRTAHHNALNKRLPADAGFMCSLIHHFMFSF